MKTLADIKRRAQVGTRMLLMYAAGLPAGHAPIERTITHVQSNAIAMTPWPGRTADSWLHWPVASWVRIEDDDTFTILEDGRVELTYRFI